VRSKIIRDSLTDPAYFEKMSTLLDEIIKLRKARAIEYEEYLQRIANIAAQVQAGKAEDTPAPLDTPGKRALYNNVTAANAAPANQVAEPAAPYGAPADDGRLALALKIDAAVKRERHDDWRGVQAREMAIKRALYAVLKDMDAVERLFLIIYAQKEY
jgi:type I restriction enzyme R subunit